MLLQTTEELEEEEATGKRWEGSPSPDLSPAILKATDQKVGIPHNLLLSRREVESLAMFWSLL